MMNYVGKFHLIALNCRHVLQINKITKKNILLYLKVKLPPNCRETFSGNIRTTFHAILCQSNKNMNSFFPDAIAL